MNTLPDKPSELIRAALKDLEAIEKMPEKYKIDMHEWHGPTTYKREKIAGSDVPLCSVCLAGAVMAQTLHVSPDEFRHPADFTDSDIGYKLRAINLFREGEITRGLDCMGYTTHKVLNKFEKTLDEINYNSKNPQQFKTEMLARADALENEGL